MSMNQEGKEVESDEVTPVEVEPVPTVVEPDLEALRDEKCIPIANALIEDMAQNLMPEGSNLLQIDARPVAMKGLELFLNANLNIATEASYVPQLVLGALAGLNATVQTCDVIQPDDVRYAKIARQILQLVSDAKVPLTKVTGPETEAAFAPVKEKLNALFAEEKITSLELKYIMDAIFNSFTAVNNLISGSLEQSSAKAEAKLFGIDAMSDLTMKKLDEVLTSPTE